MLARTWSRPAVYAAFLVLAAACGRTTLKADPVDDGSGGGGAGGGGAGPAVCGNGVVETGEDCDDANAIDTDACVVCQAAACGDGFVQAGVEGCDDGNDDNFDDCRNDCTPSTCGNGILEPPEACDDGNASNEDFCLNNCLSAACGDGFVQIGVEDCDDQNTNQTDACLNDCSMASCGDGFVWQGVEPCDDGNDNDNDGCRNNCSLPSCGDGQLDPGEQCDDGNNNNFDGCRNNCILPFCGDVIVDPGEQCDDGNNVSTDACINCVSAFCGDGFVRMGVEQCDDGNQNNFDGCRNSCVLPFCGDGIQDAGEQCDDGNVSNNDACVQGCLSNVCGDGFLFNGVEQCDDGNLINGDGCSNICQLPICGDGLLDPGEQCDLGPANEDRPALEVEQQGSRFAVMPVENTQDVAVFYNYFSASSHTGFEQVQTSRLYFYRQQATEILSLITHHGVDFFPPQPQAQVIFNLTGVPATTSVAIADDTPAEWQKTGATTVAGNWLFANNTDGGALTNLPFPGNWVISLTNSFMGAINSFEFIDQGISIVPLQLNVPVILRAYDTPSACRLDCTVPSCGDGVVDGGEVCDDGNNMGGDGCAADCSSLAG